MLLVDGLREELAKTRFDLEVHVSPASFLGKPDATLEKLAREKRDAAWILLGAPPPLQHWFMERGLPCGLIGARHPGISLPSVGTDYHALGHAEAIGKNFEPLVRNTAGHGFPILVVPGSVDPLNNPGGANPQIVEFAARPSSYE